MSDAKNKILDDLTGLATGLGIAAQGVREEFEAVRARAVAAREENAALRAEIDALKKQK